MIIIYTRDGAKPNVLPKINFEKTIRADRNKVFDLVTDYEKLEKHPDVHFIGYVDESGEVNLITKNGNTVEVKAQGWTHF